MPLQDMMMGAMPGEPAMPAPMQPPAVGPQQGQSPQFQNFRPGNMSDIQRKMMQQELLGGLMPPQPQQQAPYPPQPQPQPQMPDMGMMGGMNPFGGM